MPPTSQAGQLVPPLLPATVKTHRRPPPALSLPAAAIPRYLEPEPYDPGVRPDVKPVDTVLADPPWRLLNDSRKVAPEHKWLSHHDTMDWKDIAALPVATRRK